MKKLRFIILLGLFTVMPFSVIHAIDLNIESPHVVAETMPDSTEIFIATRIGSNWIAELDTVLMSMYDKLPESVDVQPITIDNAFREGFAEQGLDWDLFLSLLGDYAAIGLEPINSFNDDEEPMATIVIEITEQAATDVILNLITGKAVRSEEGDVIRYDNVGDDQATILITDTHIVATTNPNYSLNPTAPLSASSEFTNALNMLQEDQYDVLAYASEATVKDGLSDEDAQGLRLFGLNPETAGALAMGFTFQDGNTFTTDVAVESSATAPSSTVDISYLNAMPASTDAFIVATDLTNMYNNAISIMQETAKEDGKDENPALWFELMFRWTGLDLEEDVLSWTTGGYGVFLGADVMDIITEMATTESISNPNIEAGFVIEATDIDLARNTSEELGQFFELISADNDEMTVSQTDFNGSPATLIYLDVAAKRGNPAFELELVLTTTDDFFFFGTRSAFDSIMSGNTLADNTDFAATVPQLLENPTSVWYTNSDGLLIPTVVGMNNNGGFGMMQRAFGNMFGQIDDTSQALDVLDSFDNILTSMTLTTAVDNAGVIRLRGTVTVNQ
jgi:hypothetical protein